jgi:hypothetical protein
MKIKPLNTHLGFSFDVADFLKPISDPIEQQVKSAAQEYLTPEQYAQASSALKSGGLKLEQSIKDRGTQFLTQAAGQYAERPEVQDNAATGAIQAGADYLKGATVSMMDSWRRGTFYKDYQTPILIAGGVAGLLMLRFVIGKKRTVFVKPAKANPRRKRRAKKRK